MIPLGQKEKRSSVGAVDSPSTSRSRISYPSFSVNDIVLPLGPKDVGKTISAMVTLKVNKAGAEIEEYGPTPGKKIYKAAFSVLGIDLGKKAIDPKTMSSGDLDELEEMEHKNLSGLKYK